LPLLAFFANLMVMGWAIGLMVVALVLRYELGAEGLAWAVTFAIMPICGVYYPVEVLPVWLQPISLALPASHVFEPMRAVIIDHLFRIELLYNALLLNLVYVLAGTGVFLYAFHIARRRDLLLHVGE
jgi:ABC-2 type transport system permease protein